MDLTFLGTGAGNYRGGHRQPSSVLLDRILLDCGAGATGRLHDAGLFDRVDAVVLTHLHTDHLAGLFDFLLHTIIQQRKRPLSILTPPGLSPILKAMNEVRATVIDPAEMYPLRIIEAPRPEATVGPWTIQSLPLDHTVYNVGYLLTSDSVRVFYTGDTREPSAAEGLRTDLLIHEATFADRYADRAHEFGHSTASQAGRVAARMGARRLFVTHLASLPDTESEVLREVRAAFPDSEVAEDRGHYSL